MAKSFDLRKQLKLHDNVLLRRLFAGQEAMADVPWEELRQRDVEPIATAWEQMGEARQHFQVILQDVNELADQRGQKVLLEEIEWRCPDKLSAFSELKSPADKALWAYLEAREAFDQAAIFARAEALRSGQFANRWNSLPKEEITVNRVAVVDVGGIEPAAETRVPFAVAVGRSPAFTQVILVEPPEVIDQRGVDATALVQPSGPVPLVELRRQVGHRLFSWVSR